MTRDVLLYRRLLKYTGMNSFSVSFFLSSCTKDISFDGIQFPTSKVSIKPTQKFSLAQVSILEDLAGRGIKTS